MKHTASKVREQEETYRQIFNSISDSIFIFDLQSRKIVDLNQSACKLWGFNLDEIALLNIGNFSSGNPPYTRTAAIELIRKAAEEGPQFFEWQAKRKSGELFWVEIELKKIKIGRHEHVLGIACDISERRRLREELNKAHENLEKQIEKRNRELQQKTKEQKETLQKLYYKTEELQKSNVALKVLLKQSSTSKLELEEKVGLNIKDLIIPYLDELNIQLTDKKAAVYVEVLRKNIDKITSSFTQKLSSKLIGLTSRELQVADLVKQGKTNKEIAELLHLSPGTVELYRSNIRKKLNITNKKINLRSYLLTHE